MNRDLIREVIRAEPHTEPPAVAGGAGNILPTVSIHELAVTNGSIASPGIMTLGFSTGCGTSIDPGPSDSR